MGRTLAGLLAAVLGAGCTPDAPLTEPGSEYGAVVRASYFDGAEDPEDWRTHPVTRDQARADLDVLADLLNERYAYNEADDLDEKALLAAIAEALPQRMPTGDFAMQLQKGLALSIDGHAPRIAGLAADGDRERIENNPPGRYHFPFELRSTGTRIVAFDPTVRTLVDDRHPYVVSIDGVSVSEWIEVAQSIIVRGSPQLRWRRGSRHLNNISFLRIEAGSPDPTTADLVLEDEDGTSTSAITVELIDVEPPDFGERYPLAGDWSPRVPPDIAYFRLRRMESDSAFIAGFAAWIQESRGAQGAIIDIRDNGGGSRLPLLTLLPHVLAEDAAPVVVTAGKLKLPLGCPGPECEEPEEGYLANRFMLPVRAIPEGSAERAALEAWLPGFTPEWVPPATGFSDWHYLVVGPAEDPVFADKPVVILMNNGNFSASDIFLSGLKGLEGVTLVGTASSGGSARRAEYVLPNTDLAVSLATLASFQGRNGELYDGVGIEPDVVMEPEPGFFINASDLILDFAVDHIRKSMAGGP